MLIAEVIPTALPAPCSRKSTSSILSDTVVPFAFSHSRKSSVFSLNVSSAVLVIESSSMSTSISISMVEAMTNEMCRLLQDAVRKESSFSSLGGWWIDGYRSSGLTVPSCCRAEVPEHQALAGQGQLEPISGT